MPAEPFLVMLGGDLTQQHLLSSLLRRQYFWLSVSRRLFQSPAKTTNLLRNLDLSPSTHVVTCKQVEIFPFNVLAQLLEVTAEPESVLFLPHSF